MIEVRALRVNGRRVDEEGARRRFSSRILPAYARHSPKVGEVIRILDLRGLSTGDFRPDGSSCLGKSLNPNTRTERRIEAEPVGPTLVSRSLPKPPKRQEPQ